MKTNIQLLRWLQPFFAPYRWILFLVLCLAFITTMADLSYPYLSKVFIDHVLIEQKYSLKSIILLTFLIVVLSVILQNVNSYIYLHATLNITKKLRMYLFDRLEHLSYEFFVRTKIGDLTNRLNSDLNIVQGTLTDGVLQFIMSVFHFFFIAAMLLYLNWQLFLTILFIFPLLIWSMFYFRPKLVQKTKEIRALHGDIQSHIIETFSHIRSIKLLQAECERTERLGRKINTLNNTSLQYALLESIAAGIPKVTTAVAAALVLLIGGMKVLNGTLTVGSLLAFTTYLSRFFTPVQTMAGLYIRFQNMFVSLERIIEYLHLPSEDTLFSSHPKRLDEAAMFQFVNVCKQTGNKKYLFNDVNVVLRSGYSYALIGASGIGKSTFVDLLVRLTKPSRGTILFRGNDLESLSIYELRQKVLVIPQEVEMIHDTVKENLLLGLSEEKRRQITENELFHVCKQVSLHDEIQRLPEQYETVIGERGKLFSGGQKQRLAIARGLLRDPEVLILDEATSGLDFQAEREIFTRLDEWCKERPNRMLIIISHRLASLDWLQRYLIIENGMIVETTGYDEMMNRIEMTKQAEEKGGKRSESIYHTSP
jgi:ABC-type bacteriocin/lantibiotic exporter with double-glycine peptidase domain